MYPHRIRLRGPWDCEPIGVGIDARLPFRVTMPSRWPTAQLPGFQGQALFVRKFGYPGQVDPSEHIWLTCDGCTGCRDVRLNGHLLSDNPDAAFAFDVSKMLDHRNRLEVCIQGGVEDAGLWGEVALEIRRDAYLDGVGVRRVDHGVEITGRVVGTAPEPLELYTLVDNRNAHYRTIQPTPPGTPFHILLSDVPENARTIRIDLVHVSTIWYALEVPVSPEGTENTK